MASKGRTEKYKDEILHILQSLKNQSHEGALKKPSASILMESDSEVFD